MFVSKMIIDFYIQFPLKHEHKDLGLHFMRKYKLTLSGIFKLERKNFLVLPDFRRFLNFRRLTIEYLKR